MTDVSESFSTPANGRERWIKGREESQIEFAVRQEVRVNTGKRDEFV